MTLPEILRNKKEEIISQWIKQLAENIPMTKFHDQPTIENSIPDLLDAMANALESDENKEVVFYSQSHGLNRSKYKEYTLGHVIKEYNVLRKIIFSFIDQYENVNFEDRNIIIYIIDQAIEQAAETYHRIKQKVLIDARDLANHKAEELELTDESREEFIQAISHDLNNPLNNVIACINLLEDGIEVDEVNTILSMIRSSVDKADALIKNFLDARTVENQKFPVNKAKADILEDLKKEIFVYRVSQKRNIVLKCNQDKILANVDLDLIRRAFDNLMSNALKHSKGKSQILVECYKDDHKFSIAISNPGEQVPEETLKNIFNRYYRLHNERPGWGIGLSLVKKIAEAHNGSVNAVNDNNSFTFKLIIPLNDN